MSWWVFTETLLARNVPWSAPGAASTRLPTGEQTHGSCQRLEGPPDSSSRRCRPMDDEPGRMAGRSALRPWAVKQQPGPFLAGHSSQHEPPQQSWLSGDLHQGPPSATGSTEWGSSETGSSSLAGRRLTSRMAKDDTTNSGRSAAVDLAFDLAKKERVSSHCYL